MVNFPILNNSGHIIGRVEESIGNSPAISVVINDVQLRYIAICLNRKIAGNEKIIGSDGVGRVIQNLVHDESRLTLFSKIESLSGAQLHVGQVLPSHTNAN